MQWNQPGPEDRPRVLIFAAIGAIFGFALSLSLVAAVVRSVPVFEGQTAMSALIRVATLAWAVLAAGMGALSGYIFLRTRRAGPRRPSSRTLRSEEIPLIVVLLAIGFVALAFDAGAIDALLGSRTNAPVLVWFIVVMFGLLGLAGFLGAAIVAWNAVRRGPTTLTLGTEVVPAGEPLDVRLEIPFAADAAPEAIVSVALTRWEAGATSEDPATSTTVWEEFVHVDTWEDVGEGRAGAELTFQLPEGEPCDLPEDRVSYVWGLVVHPVDQVAWNAHFTLPVRFVSGPEEQAA